MPKTISLWEGRSLTVSPAPNYELISLTVDNEASREGREPPHLFLLDRRGVNELIEQLREARAGLVAGAGERLSGNAAGLPIRDREDQEHDGGDR